MPGIAAPATGGVASRPRPVAVAAIALRIPLFAPKPGKSRPAEAAVRRFKLVAR
jgi:hypothetical protein